MTLIPVYHFSASLDLICLKTSFSIRTIVLLSHTFIAGFYSHWLFGFFFLPGPTLIDPFTKQHHYDTYINFIGFWGRGCVFFCNAHVLHTLMNSRYVFYCYARSFTSTKYFFPLFPRKNDCISDSYKLTSKKSTRRLKQLRGTRIPFEF